MKSQTIQWSRKIFNEVTNSLVMQNWIQTNPRNSMKLQQCTSVRPYFHEPQVSENTAQECYIQPCCLLTHQIIDLLYTSNQSCPQMALNSCTAGSVLRVHDICHAHSLGSLQWSGLSDASPDWKLSTVPKMELHWISGIRLISIFHH